MIISLSLRLLLAFTLAAALPVTQAAAQSRSRAADEEQVRRAMLDYIEAFYEADTAKLVRSVHPAFYKFGFGRRADGAYSRGGQMTWEAALNTLRNSKAANRPRPANRIKQVDVFEISEQIASGKVTAHWGIDYMLLGRYEGRWMISHVLWQASPPAARADSTGAPPLESVDRR